MDHRSVIKNLIILVIGVVVLWSIVNISQYAYEFHPNPVVWSLGFALGCANALSVYAFVIAKSQEVRNPAIAGILLFGGMSAALQIFHYLDLGAPVVAAWAFGLFGPVAEGVLSWMHAALSEEKARKPAQNAKAKTAQVTQIDSATIAQIPAQNMGKVAQRRAQIQSANITDKMQIMRLFGVSQRTAETDLKAIKEAPVYLNGNGYGPA